MITRRDFLHYGAGAGLLAHVAHAQAPTYRREKTDQQSAAANGVRVLHARNRVPLSFVIDDSTCLVNMGHYCMPQFAEAWPQRDSYKKPWRSWPREIPDSFVAEFADFCEAEGVRGKYSVVPFPACVGWVDREMPGWSRRQLQASLKLVRERIVPRFDIHPEMITHTRVIDLKTGRPLEAIHAGTMENSYPQEDKSVDELAAYLAYALRILKNCDLPCEGVTTPGGFGNRVKSELALAVFEAVRDVYGTDLPHYFKYVIGNDRTDVKLEHVREPDSETPRVTANVPAATGDWFGGWDGDRESEGPRYASEDGQSGRLVELIRQGRPAVMLCHWPGMYCNGSRRGYEDFRRVVRALREHYGEQTQWMKLSEMGRYEAAKQLTRFSPGRDGRSLFLQAPFDCPKFTIELVGTKERPQLKHADQTTALRKADSSSALDAGQWLPGPPRGPDNLPTVQLCFDLPQGRSQLRW